MDLKSKIILIYGPTASGKSNFAIKLARKIKGEIINADSMQVYKELKILSARPFPKNYKNIKHHLYGFKSVKKNFFVPIFLCNNLIFDLNRIGIFGIFTKPSVIALKYNPVPPTRIGVFFLFFISRIFLLTNFNQSPEEKFFFTL